MLRHISAGTVPEGEIERNRSRGEPGLLVGVVRGALLWSALRGLRISGPSAFSPCSLVPQTLSTTCTLCNFEPRFGDLACL